MTAQLARPHSNPSAALSAVGAVVGGAVGGIATAAIIGLALRLREGAGREGDVQTRGQMRLTHAVAAAGTFVGSAYGAYLGAAPHQKARAVTGAMIGTGTIVLPTIAISPFHPGAGWWDFGLGSLGAGVGAAIGAAGA